MTPRAMSRAGAIRVAALIVAALAMPAFAPAAAHADSFQWPVILQHQGSLNAVACSAADECVVSGGDSTAWEIAFNPASPGAPARHNVPGNNGLGPIACPSATQCTGITDNESEVTFNPASPGSPAEVSVDDAPFVSGDAWGVLALSCPSTTQCTATDSNGQEVTFNPQSPGTPTTAAIAGSGVYLNYLSCPSTTQCTAFDRTGAETTFNPGAPGSTSPKIISTHTLQSTFNVGGIACPSASQCTVAYTYPGGGTHSYESTFNPSSPNPTVVGLPLYVSSGNGLANLISCPSATQCTVSGADANSGNPEEATFNPQAPGHPAAMAMTDGDGSISCPSVNECVIVNLYGEVAFGTNSGGGGHAKCLVPRVKGKTLAAAKRAIVKAHCTLGKVTKKPSTHFKKGHVISQRPSAGKSLRSRSKVSLVVSKG